jgi:hypothetical protein
VGILTVRLTSFFGVSRTPRVKVPPTSIPARRLWLPSTAPILPDAADCYQSPGGSAEIPVAQAGSATIPAVGGRADTTDRFTVKRILFTTTWFSALVALAIWAYLDGWWAFSYAIGSVWMMLNFVALAGLLRLITALPSASKLFIFTLICAKIAVVFIALYWLFQIRELRPLGLVAGITTLLVVILLKATGQALFKRPDSGEIRDEQSR